MNQELLAYIKDNSPSFAMRLYIACLGYTYLKTKDGYEPVLVEHK